MNKWLLAVLLLASTSAAAQKAVIVVRHAEKASQTEKDPELSIPGQDRALKLTELLRGQKVDAIFATDLKRTQQTVAPLASTRKLTPTIVKADDTAGLIGKISKLPADAVAVVAGHSNTVPEILKALGVAEKVDIADDEYSRVFIVVPGVAGKPATLIEVKY